MSDELKLRHTDPFDAEEEDEEEDRDDETEEVAEDTPSVPWTVITVQPMFRPEVKCPGDCDNDYCYCHTNGGNKK